MASSVIGALRVDLGIDTAAFSDGLKQAGSKLSGFGAVLRKAIIPLAAVGTAAAVGVGAAVKSTVNAADEMSKAASKFGIPIEELSRLKYAADLSDVSLEGLGTAVGRLSRNMADAAGGSKEAVDAFAAVGVEFQNADGSLRNTSDVLSDISARFAAMPDGAAKTAAAMELMGRSGAEMIPLLNGGAEALAKMKAEADTFGQVFTAEMGTNAEAFNDNITRLQGAFANLAADLTAKLLPYLAQFTDWLVREGPGIAERAGNIVALGAAFVSAGQSAAQFVRDVVNGFLEVRQAVRDFDQQITAAFENTKNALVQVGRDLISGLWEGIKARWAELIADAKGLATGLVGKFREWWDTHSPSTVFADIGRDVMAGLAQGLESNQAGIQSGMQSFAQDLASQFEGILTGATSFREALGSILGSVGSNLISGGIGSLFKGLGFPGFANGTNNAPRGYAWVGERGPELMQFSGGERVIPNHALGGGVTRIEVAMAPGVEARIVSQANSNAQVMIENNNRSIPARVASARSDPRFRG